MKHLCHNLPRHVVVRRSEPATADDKPNPVERDANGCRQFFAVVADHGESLGEHGEMTHSNLCYDSTIRVPMFLRYPSGFRAGERSDEVVSAFGQIADEASLETLEKLGKVKVRDAGGGEASTPIEPVKINKMTVTEG